MEGNGPVEGRGEGNGVLAVGDGERAPLDAAAGGGRAMPGRAGRERRAPGRGGRAPAAACDMMT